MFKSNTTYIHNNKRVYPTKWKSRTICGNCNYIFNEWADHTTCLECGSQNNSIKSVRWIYDHWMPFYRNLIEIQVK